MSTESNDWAAEPERMMTYEHHPWGEFIMGTKDQIQRLGIAVDLDFPGPTGKIEVADPRGLQTLISAAYDRLYYVRIDFPGREHERKKPIDFAPGVRLAADTPHYDEYKGTAQALTAARLVRVEHLPGAPGMRKMKVTILANGTIASGPPTTALNGKGREPGATTITSISRISYRVCIWVPAAERDRRNAASTREREEYAARMNALPRPAPLTLKARQHGKVVSLQEVRFARMLEARKPVNNADDIRGGPGQEKRRLLWVSLGESNLLSTIYENRFEEAVRLLQVMTGNKQSFLLSP
jgi:hypothetical protein